MDKIHEKDNTSGQGRRSRKEIGNGITALIHIRR